MKQLFFFPYQTIQAKDFVNGKAECVNCGRKMMATGYNLSKQLVGLGFDIQTFLVTKHRQRFSPPEVWPNDFWARTQFQKLKIHFIIAPTGHSGWWRLTQKGDQFLRGDITLPNKVWSFDDLRVRVENDERVHVGQVAPEWKTRSIHWKLDYLIPTREMVQSARQSPLPI